MRVALVTGGGSGIGRSAALELNKIDFTVYVVGRREEELIKTASPVSYTHLRAHET